MDPEDAHDGDPKNNAGELFLPSKNVCDCFWLRAHAQMNPASQKALYFFKFSLVMNMDEPFGSLGCGKLAKRIDTIQVEKLNESENECCTLIVLHSRSRILVIHAAVWL